jgi:hypothetical protein
MWTSRTLRHLHLALLALAVLASAAFAQGENLGAPGTPVPAAAVVSEQKAGSVLIYNLYSSIATAPHTENTRISVTNTHPTSGVSVHLFFVSEDCSVADAALCLTKSQTATFLISDIDPGITGYLVVIASDSLTGCPISFNYLLGEEYVKLASGHVAGLGAEAFAALYGRDFTPLPGCPSANATATVAFDGLSYNLTGRALALDSIPGRTSGNNTLLIINRTGGDLTTGGGKIGSLFGLVFDDAENGYSFTTTGGCQFQRSITDTFPRTVPRLSVVIPAGHTGWMKFWSTSADDDFSAGGRGILGAALNFHRDTASDAGAFNGGHNFHKLTLTSDRYIVPVFPAMCQ